METENQPTPMPTRKVTAAGIGGAAATVLIWGAAQFGLEIPAEVAAGIVALIAAAAGYMTQERADTL